MRLGPAIAITLLLCAGCDAGDGTGSGAAEYLSSYTWQEDAPWFGGLSGIELSADGHRATLLSDRARLITADLTRDADGRVVGAELTGQWPLRASTGQRLKGQAADSEGLATGPDGQIYISFEDIDRVARYARPGAPARVLNDPRTFGDPPRNRSLEALAMDGAGRLYTLPENAPDARGQIPVYRRDGQDWHIAFTLPPRGRFLPVGADFDPEGRLYVLERAVTLLGFRSRLRRWTLENDQPVREETLLTTAAGRHDNLEGVAIWRDNAGRLRATLVSDDNFLRLQRTELVDYLLPD
ncbi:esterase-like activity of phytase family protein [Pseudodonghicola flavimaris]|uniref:Esterase-like activity of phytase family protein n=1 Tax=Pseudodonghicola flavimaris TaxID=3050036 RepID=A0ABT7EZK9_9RHOB|nr:esterase-like activity of phytase family protein [Pseudodonghicola flavimaris]MDK3017777.1 esterase-like activity of phytase family protein [Pseudodonghicola flavimaris]